MKNPKLGDYLLWKDKPAKVVSVIDRPAVGIEMLEDAKCPHCGNSLGKDYFVMIPTSPLFQENATTIPAMEDNPTLKFLP